MYTRNSINGSCLNIGGDGAQRVENIVNKDGREV